MEVRVILISENCEAQEAYGKELVRLGVTFDSVGSFSELHAALKENAYSGVLVDVPTLIKGSASDKAMVQGLLDYFPVLRLRYNREEKSVSGLFYGQMSGDGNILQQFVEAEAKPFRPRTFRSHSRNELTLNVTVYRNNEKPNGGSAGMRTVTINVSEGGCFILTGQDFDDSDQLSIVIRELEDQTPIPVDIRWRVRWGEAMRMPGLGVAFLSITEGQREELRIFLRGRKAC